MKFAFLAGVAATALSGCSAPAPSPDPDPSPAASAAPTPAASAVPLAPVAVPTPARLLTAQGYDTVRINATPAEAGWGLVDNRAYQDSCRIYTSPRLPGLAAMVEGGRIRRVTLYTAAAGPSSIRTERGIGLGATEAAVRAAYRPLGEEPHKYEPAPAKYLNHGEEGVPQALRFEIGTDGKVGEIHAGESPWLGYVESCS